jgi:myo-inositol-1(or 4)-monophosphatase
MNQFLEVAAEAAREAGSLLLAEFDRPQNITYKGEVDIVTESDRRSEALIVSRLRDHFPAHAIVAEEGGEGAATGARYCWHVDPLDGTTNFAHGYPCFAVSLGLLEDGDPLLGVVSPVEKLSASLLATGFPTDKVRQSQNINYYWAYTLRTHGVRRDGSAALDLCSVACGRFDAFWEFGLKSWDTAAGILLVKEAGGTVSDFSGRPYRPGDPVLLASNGRIHSEMQKIAADIAERAPKV